MKLVGYLLTLCNVLRSSLALIVSLSERGAEFSDTIILNDSPRSISLVPGRTYSISCEGTEWHRNGQLVTATSVIDGVPGAYVVSNGDARTLMLQLFSESLVGRYSCTDGSGEEFIINITTGNPVLIQSQVVMGLEGGFLRQSLPFFSVFGSGDPEPVPSNYSWYFNGHAIYVNRAVDSSVVDVNTLFDRVTYNRITLRQRVESSVEGTYVSVVNTAVGEARVSITINIEAAPDPRVSVIIPTDYSTNSLATGESVTFNCSDFMADPLPNLSWMINDEHVHSSQDGITIISANKGRESYLTIVEVDFTMHSDIILCQSTNMVEGEEDFEIATATLKVLAPPPPPHNLTAVQTLSSCWVELSWESVPPVDPDTTLPPQFHQIEARAGGERGQWEVVEEHIDASSTSTEVSVKKAFGMSNMSYDFRISSGNERGGVSPVSTETKQSIQLFFDTHECETTCSKNATYSEFVGGFNCTCNSGFSGDGFSCQEINETLYQNNATHTDRCDCDCNPGLEKAGENLLLVMIIGCMIIIGLVLSVVTLSIVLAVVCHQKRREICRSQKQESNILVIKDNEAYGRSSATNTEPNTITTVMEKSEDHYEQIRV